MGTDDDPDSLPELVNRRTEYDALTDRLQRNETCLHLYGPKGGGKSLLVEHALQTLPPETMVCRVSCRQQDTQYKVMTSLCNTVADGEFRTGYHTAQLYAAFSQALSDQKLVVVLDDVDFLLLNDGSDLLYALSRMDQQRPQLILISATYPDLRTELDERTYSSLLPETVDCPAYSEPGTRQVLTQRAPDWVDRPVTDDAIAHIATATANIAFGQHWLIVAEEVTDGPITADVVQLVRPDALQRYRTAQLARFSEHHRLVLDAIKLLTADTEPVHSGAVYNWYDRLCRQMGTAPLSTRRISTFLKHLELLGLIAADYHYGGDDGKTRDIWLEQIGE